MALTDNLQAYWKFDESSGNALDSSGNGRTLTNAGNVSYSTGKINNGAYFSKASGYNFSTSNFINVENPFSISYWIYISEAGSFGTLMAKGSWTETSQIQYIRYAGNKIGFVMRNGGDEYFQQSGTYSTNTWVYVTLTKSGTGSTGLFKLYINGTLDNTGTINNLSNISYDLKMGRLGDSTNYSYGMNGRCDEIGVWNRELTSIEVTELYNSGVGLPYPLKTLRDNLVEYWKLDETSGNAIGLINSTTLNNSNVTFVPGKINNGASFNGTSNDLTGYNSLLQMSYNLSFNLWFKTSTSDGSLLIQKASSSGGWFAYGAEIKSNKLHFKVKDSTAFPSFTEFDVSGSYNDGNWHMVTFTLDSSGFITVYVDGSVSASTSLYGNSIYYQCTGSYAPFSIGNSTYYSGGACDTYNTIEARLLGIVDEVGIWNKVLNPTEVTQLYNSSAGLSYPFIVTPTSNTGIYRRRLI
jgi:MSHA biogenesis protein MshQ